MSLFSPYIYVLVVILIVEPITRTKAQVLQSFNDREFANQYYLVKDLMNIQKAWNENLTGEGITICVNDPTGVDFRHPDLSKRHRSEASFNFLTNRSWPTPNNGGYDGSEAHGTMMAGLAAAEANNGNCGVGVAYKASISGLKTGLHRPSETSWNAHRAIARSMEYKNDINDIFCNSWGLILARQNNIAYLHPWTRAAIKNSAENGRKGKGSIIVFSTGNGGVHNGTCSYDELVSSIYTIGISVITGNHEMSGQNVKCAGVTAVTYGRDGMDGIDNPNFLMPAAGLQGRCSKTAASSSASAAVASGILALVLQANPKLTWRDVQHLIARSSSSHFSKVQWKRNGAGLNVSDGFGFGVMDAKALTDNAKIWKNVDKQLTCTIPSVESVVIDGIETLTKEIDLQSNRFCKEIKYLEHVVLVMKFNFTWRKNIEVTLQSPSGTKSIMLRSGRYMDRKQEVTNLGMLSLHHWGENPGLKWKLTLRNVKPRKDQSGYLSSYSLKLYGTSSDPMLNNSRIKPSTLGLQSAATTDRPTTRLPKDTTTGCYDTETACKGWADAGYCITNQYTKNNCRRSCGFCSDVDSGYGQWTTWSACSKSCGDGTKTRRRQCNNPFPGGNGIGCSRLAKATETSYCNQIRCRDVDGGYGQWTTWSACSKSCGGGTKTRTRHCNNPSPEGTGRTCSRLGRAADTRSCNQERCPGPPPYIGCYRYSFGRQLWYKSMRRNTASITQECIHLCRRRRSYYALLRYDRCYCFYNLRRYKKKPDGFCDSKCEDKTSLKCGGYWGMSVYTLDLDECKTVRNDCQHRCINTFGSFKCSCHSGYYLGSDRKSCYDLDECTRTRNDCQHRCINTFGSFKCSCNSGYYLGSDRKSCYADCKITNSGAEYRGKISVTNTGKTCQRWDSQWPHRHDRTARLWPKAGLAENYCRNPDKEKSPWCYTTSENSRSEPCDIPACVQEAEGKMDKVAKQIQLSPRLHLKKEAAVKDCKDLNSACLQYKELGYCTSRSARNYIMMNCKKSCGLCNE